MRYRLLRRLKCALVGHAWDDSPWTATMKFLICARCRRAYPKPDADLATVAHAQSYMDGYQRGAAQARHIWRESDL